MQLLTTSGYKSIEDCNIGEQLIAYDVFDGSVIINELLGKQWMSADMFEDVYSEPEQVVDENGEPVFDEDGNPVMTEPVLIKTKREVFEETYGELSSYRINDRWDLYWGQSIWANLNVVHAQDLQVGDIVYDDKDNDIEITSIEKIDVDGWWRLSVSGDHSYIADDLTLHNASRYWVGGGASANWNATGNTNWGSASGGANNASVPTSVDDVTFDGAGTNGNTNSTISATITILSLDIQTGYTATMTHNAVLTIAGDWTYTENYTIAGASSVTISGNSTITSNGVTWPNALTFTVSSTKTLVGNLVIGGTLTISLNNTINKTTNETLSCNGLNVTAFLLGTAKIILKGGTWLSANTRFTNDLDIDGNVTISGTVYKQGGVITYISGTVTTTGSTLSINTNTNTVTSITLNTNGITWNNITRTDGYTLTVTLTSNLSIAGTITITSGQLILNKTTSETVTINNGITISGSSISGTAKIILTGGTWSGSNAVSNDLDIDGDVTIIGSVTKGSSGSTLQYLSGKVTSNNAILNIVTNQNVLGFSKCPLSAVVITAGQTVTMDSFFCGTPSQSCVISSTGANYTIAFQDRFEKIGRFVKLSGATIANRNQLLVTNNSRFNTNRSTNIGVRYINQSPNGIPKGEPSINDTMTVPALGLVSDPNFVKQ